MNVFVSHLRSVHFTLVVTGLALVVAGSLAPDAVFEDAYDQVGEIEAIVTTIDATIPTEFVRDYLDRTSRGWESAILR